MKKVLYISGPQPFWTQGLVLWKTVFPWTGQVGDGHGSGGNVNDGKQWGMADEGSLTFLPLTSCCVVHFLTGHRPVPVLSLGVGDLLYMIQSIKVY